MQQPQPKRLDGIGQELKVNECVYVISKSSNTGGSVCLVTKMNESMIQVNGKSNIADDCLIVVTQNLIELGKQGQVDRLRAQYADKIVVVDPDAPPKKEPVRFMLWKDQTGDQHLIRVEAISREGALNAMKNIPSAVHFTNTHNYSCMTMGETYMDRGYRKCIHFGNGWRFNKSALWSYRSLPDNIARHVDDSMPHIIIPLADHQPDKVILPKK